MVVERRIGPQEYVPAGQVGAAQQRQRVTGQPDDPPGRTRRALAQPLGGDHRGERLTGHRRQQGVQAPDPGIPERGALLGVPVHLDDGVVDVHQHQPGVPRRTQQPGPGRQRGQEPGRDRVHLADMSEGEGPQEGPQRGRRVRRGEHLPHPAVAQQGHVIDTVRPGSHPSHQRGQLQPGVGALVGRHAHMLVSQFPQPRPAGQTHQRDQSRRSHQVGLIKRSGRHRPGMRELHLRSVLPSHLILDLITRIFPAQKDTSALPRPPTIGGSRLTCGCAAPGALAAGVPGAWSRHPAQPRG